LVAAEVSVQHPTAASLRHAGLGAQYAAEAETIGPDILASVRLWLVDMTVSVEFWQMQCCGEPFRLGDRVAWTVRATDTDWLEVMLGTHAQPGVDAVEDHHGGVPEDGTDPGHGDSHRCRSLSACPQIRE
jgi:hypothetical protein